MYDDERFDCDIRELQAAILNEFPSEPYTDRVLDISHDPSVYEVKEDNLDMLLKGKSWRDIDPAFVESNHDEYVLMNEGALPAFLGAWLWTAAQNLHSSNRVMSSLIFHLAKYGTSTGSGLWARGFKGLNQKQRDIVNLLLKCAAANATNSQDRAQIEKAMQSVEINRCPK